MCQDHHDTAQEERPTYHDAFPWDAGVFDAHCHPTDTMAAVADIPGMRARLLTVMATRSQDQHLVAEVADGLGVKDKACLDGSEGAGRVVPCFGWHPWFSHQLYDDAAPEPTYKPPSSAPGSTSNDSSDSHRDDPSTTAKEAHYKAVLAPSPSDPSFLASLPEPVPLSSFIAATRDRLAAYPLALVGEVGLDKAFRLPRQWDPDATAARDDTLTPGGREGRLLSPQRVRIAHQQSVLAAQLRLAGELGRAVSLHGVQAHGALYDTVAACWKGHERKVVSRRQKRLDAPGAVEEDSDDEGNGSKPAAGGKPFPPRICLHSYSGTVEVLRQWLHPSVPCDVFVSFSVAINMGTDNGRAKLADVVRAVPDDRVLIESDLHVAGARMDGMLEDMYRAVCEMRGWGLREGVERIRRNYQRFVFG